MTRDGGYSILEALVAAAIGAIVLMAFGTFFLATSKTIKETGEQVWLDRQAMLILEEFGRRSRPANVGFPTVVPPSSPGNCVGFATNDPILSIETGPDVVNPVKLIHCFYRDTSPSPQLLRCSRLETETDCTAENLLAGALIPIEVTAWTPALMVPCLVAGGTCPGGACTIFGYSCSPSGASIALTLTDGKGAVVSLTGTLAWRNR